MLVSPRRKRRRSSSSNEGNSFSLSTFGDPGYPANYYGAFRDNVRAFLDGVAEREPPCDDVGGALLQAWSITLHHDAASALVPLLVFEETVCHSTRPHCDHCRCVGWSHHLISNRRYHFIVPSPDISIDRILNRRSNQSNLIANTWKICPICQDSLPPSLSRCPLCNVSIPVPESFLHAENHLLHGLLHCSGYGHLLCVNGREKGSPYASGRELMDLWDRICSMLRARKVSVKDIAKKRGMELRLLHCVAYGESWFGRWGYKFGHGSYGMTAQIYAKAIEAIRGMPLSVMLHHFDSVDDDVLSIAAKYQRMSCEPLQTVGDLVRFMIELKAKLPEGSSKYNGTTKCGVGLNVVAVAAGSGAATAMSFPKLSFHGVGGGQNSTCRWSMKRLELATQVIVEALKGCEKKWMARQDVRDAARVYIGDTGLLDFVLKSLGNRRVGRYVVRRALNPITKVLEYSLHDFDDIATNPCAATHPNAHHLETFTAAACDDLGRDEVYKDITHLYLNALERYKPATAVGADASTTSPVLSAIRTASRIITDTKHMIKDYKGEVPRRCVGGSGNSADWGMIEERDEMLRVMCRLKLENEEEDEDVDDVAEENIDASLAIGGFAGTGGEEVMVRTAAAGGDGLMGDDVLDALLGSGMLIPAPVMGGGVVNMVVKTEQEAQLQQEEERKKLLKNSKGRRRMVDAELVVLPPHASVGELKRAAEWALRDTYCAMRQAMVLKLESLEGVDDEDLLFGNVESGSEVVVVVAVGGGAEEVLWSEGGGNYKGDERCWRVDCRCGAKDDDGERMIACDECDVWQHTRCAALAIADDAGTPPLRFLCAACAAAAEP